MLKKRFLSMILTVIMVISMVPANFTTPEVKAASTGTRVVGYLPSYRISTVNSIDFSALTHCILSFMTYSNGTLTSGFSAGDVQNIVNKCHSNNAKAMIAIGGWGGFDASDNPFGTSEKRTSFVNQVMNYVDTYNLDGVDIDIELTDANIWNNFDALISELSGRLKSNGKLLTMAVSTWFTGSISNSTYQYFDFLNLMSYDYNQSGTGEVAPWSQIYDMISYYGGRGVSNDKLVIGVPFYGYGSGGTAYTYSQMISMSTANANLDYASGVYYNGMDTIRKKAEYSKSYGGTMIWEIGQDSFGTYSLLNVIKQVMANSSEGTTTQTPATQEPTTSSSGGSTTGVSEWNSSTVYYQGDKVVYNGNIYQAGWWTQGETPGSASVWTLVGAAEETTTPEPTTQEPATQAPADGYVTAGANWSELDYWSVYFASGWGNNPTGSYKNGNSYNDFSVKINSASGDDWGVQMKTKTLSVEAGKNYVCKVTVQSNMTTTGQIRLKEDISATEILQTLNAGANSFELKFTASDTAQLFFDLGKAPADLEFTVTSFSLEKVAEAPTEEATTVVNTNAKVEINGCQISTTAEGYRIIYSLSDINQEVESVGLVYGLADYATESDMVVGSTNNAVYNYAATEAGKLTGSYSNMTSAQSYAMTMEFIKTASFFNQKINVRAYAKLSNGQYVYSDIQQYVIYDVADYLYQNQKMSNFAGHDYLFKEILSLVNPSYESVEYDFNHMLVKM